MPSWDQISAAVSVLLATVLAGRMGWPAIKSRLFAGEQSGDESDVVPADRAAYARYVAAVRTASPDAPPDWQQAYCEAVLSPAQVEILERIRSGKKSLPAKKESAT